VRLPDELIGELSHAALAGRLEAAIEPYVHPHVLVIDELGYQSYAADAANVPFRVVSIRHLKRRSTIVTTHKPLVALGQVLHDADLATCIGAHLGLEPGQHFIEYYPALQEIARSHCRVLVGGAAVGSTFISLTTE
jgi:hypothetical protein